MKPNKYYLFWLDGKQETIYGITIHDAITNRGYGDGDLRALDFWSEVSKADGDNWEFKDGKWERGKFID